MLTIMYAQLTIVVVNVHVLSASKYRSQDQIPSQYKYSTILIKHKTKVDWVLNKHIWQQPELGNIDFVLSG